MPRRLFVICLAVTASCLSPLALGDDTARGRALYESRCDVCHDKSVHNRATRRSRNIDEVRRWVARWNEELGNAWKDDEINAVTDYLNQRYYKFPCPEKICRSQRAAM